MQIFDLFGAITIEGVQEASNQMMFLGEKVNQIGEKLYGFGEKLYNGITKPLIGLVESGLKYNSSMEDLKTSFEVMLGSVEKAEEMTKRLIDMGAKTPFDSMQLSEYTKTMLAFGYTEANVIPIMSRLGDISLGNDAKMSSLTRTMGQINSLGKLQGGDLNQLIGQGWNPLNEITKKTGETMEEVRARMEKGKVTYQEVQDALIATTSAGGTFYQGMDKGSQTLSGRISTLRDNFMNFLGSAVMPLSNFISTTVVPVLTEWAAKLNNMSTENKTLMLIIAGIVAVIPILVMAFGAIVVVAGTVITAIGAIGSVIATIGLPVILVAGLLGGFAVAVGVVYAAIIALAIKLGIVQGAFEYLKSAVMVIVGIFKGDVAGAFDILTTKFGMTGNDAANFIVKVQNLKDQIIILVDKVKDLAAKLIDKLGDALMRVAKVIYDHRAEIMKLIGVLMDMGTTVIKVAGWVIDQFNNMYNGVKTVVNIFNTLKSNATSALNAIKDAISSVINKISQIKLPSMPSWMPGFASGVTNFQGGWAVLGEEGPEIVELPKGSNVYSNEVSKTMMDSTAKEVNIGQREVLQPIYLMGDINIDSQNIKDINSLIELFKSIKTESITRGGIV